MNTKSVPLDYVNNLMYELEKAFWDERGLGARFRMTTVGREYCKDKVLPLLKSKDIEHILNTIQTALKIDGIVAEFSYDLEERLVHVKVENCIHQPVENQMLLKDIQPFTCVPANLIVLAIEDKVDIPVELAEIKFEEGACQLLLALFEKRPVLE